MPKNVEIPPQSHKKFQNRATRESRVMANFVIFHLFYEIPAFLPFFCVLLSKNSKNSKNGRFSIITVGIASIVNVGHFFANPNGPNKFC